MPPEDALSEPLQRQLSDLRREVIEGRNFIIPTSDLLRMLNTETRVSGVRRKEFERRQLVSSAAAYAAFALLAASGLLFSLARTSEARRDRDRVVAELKALTRSVDTERAKQAAALPHELSQAALYRGNWGTAEGEGQIAAARGSAWFTTAAEPPADPLLSASGATP